MLALLVACGLLYFFLGERRDALMLLSAAFVVIAITFYQEKKTENTLESLRRLSSPRALVIRDGKQRRLAGREVVPDDLIILQEGDRVPADARVVECTNLMVDESLLTGESMPVRKTAGEAKSMQVPGGDDLPFVYSGTLIVAGRGKAIVYATGRSTQMGKIGKCLETVTEGETLLYSEVSRLVRYMGIMGAAVCGLIIGYYTLVNHNFINGLLAGLTLAMALLPEEFPVVLLIFLTLGAWRIAKQKVLARRNATIETLGAATVLCTDKTGTLTEGKMELTALFAGGEFYELSDRASTDLTTNFKHLLQVAGLASRPDPFDPLEREILQMVKLYLPVGVAEKSALVKEYPLTKNLLSVTQVWQADGEKSFIAAAKGAPEAILGLAHVSSDQSAKIIKTVNELSAKGLRVLGVAEAHPKVLPATQTEFDFKFLGLLGFIDPARSTAIAAIKEAQKAGIRIVMVTGDFPGTAQYVARQVGILNPEQYLTGEQIQQLDHLQLREAVKNVNVFARVQPDQKLLLVNALKANNEVVAMTGDGVNDAPALKAAHIGIAMGQRGTDVAREASGLVLLTDDFSSIVAAIRLGRRIYDNIRRALGYILAVHVPIAGVALLPLVFNLPPVLLPAHIAFLELIIDPTCSTVFEAEPEAANLMERPPRNLRQPMLTWRAALLNLAQGTGVMLTVFGLYLLAFRFGKNLAEARSFAFAALVIANLMLIVVNLSWDLNLKEILFSANKSLRVVLVAALLCLAAVLYIPSVAEMFHLSALPFWDIVLVASAAVFSLVWFEVLKMVRLQQIRSSVKTVKVV